MLFIGQIQGGGVFPIGATPAQYTMPWWVQQILLKTTDLYSTPFGYDSSKPLHVNIVGGSISVTNSGDGAILSGGSTVGKADVNGNYELLTHDSGVLSALSVLATETKAEAIRLLLSSVDGKDFATSAKQDTVLTAIGGLASQTKLEAVRVILASLDSKDFATNDKLEQTRLLLASLDGKDFATQSTLAAAKTTLDQIYAALDGVEGLLTQVRDKDFATSSKQDTLKTSVDVVASNIVVTNTKVDTLIAKDFATSAKQDTLKTSTDTVASNIGSTDGAAATDNTGTWSLNSLIKRLLGKLDLANSTNANEGLKVVLNGTPITGEALANPGFGGIGWLSYIRKTLIDGTQRSLIGKAITSAAANQADGTVTYQALDSKSRVRNAGNDAVDPWQAFIEKYGSISTASATDVLLQNSTTVAIGYVAQSIDYTVAAGKTFYLKKLAVTFDIPPANGNCHVTISIGGVKKLHYHQKTANGAKFMIEDLWERGYPVPAGTTVQVYVRTDSGAATVFWVRFEGYEEIN